MANNIYKYERINVKERTLDRAKWNKASLLPLFLSLFFVLCLFVPLAKVYLQRENTSTIKRL